MNNTSKGTSVFVMRSHASEYKISDIVINQYGVEINLRPLNKEDSPCSKTIDHEDYVEFMPKIGDRYVVHDSEIAYRKQDHYECFFDCHGEMKDVEPGFVAGNESGSGVSLTMEQRVLDDDNQDCDGYTRR